MKLISTSILGISLLLATACSEQPETTNTTEIKEMKQPEVSAPVAKKIPYELSAHGVTRIDNYYWMRDDERKDPEIIAHLEAENNHTKAQLAHTEVMQNRLFEEITGRLDKNDDSVPFERNGYWYYVRYEEGNEYPIYARKKGSLEAEEEIFLNVNQLAQGKDFYVAAGLRVSPDATKLVYGEDTNGRRIYDIKIKDLTTGEYLPDRIIEAESSLAWSADNQYLFYIRKDLQTLLGNRVYRHKIGTSQDDDVLMYEETDNTLYLGLSTSDDGETIILGRGNSTSGSALYLKANDPQGEFKLFQPHEVFVQYEIYPKGDDFYYMTNRDGINFMLYMVKKSDLDTPENWQVVIPHRDDVLLSDIEVFDDYLAIVEQIDGLNTLVIYDPDGKKLRDISFDDAAYSLGLSTNVTDNTDQVRISYSSLTTPDTIYDVDMTSGKLTELKQDKIIGDFDPTRYVSERFFITARDGARVPVSLVYRTDRFKKDGTHPMYLYAYGSYGSNISPRFRHHKLTLLDRGFVYAIAHIRGSSTMGRQWYEDGKLLNKKNTFTDFIDVTKALVEQKYSAADKVIAAGGSAGGLLMGAIANMAPELYFGLSAYVPWVDVVTTMSDPSIPLTTNEYTEWGNPEDKEYHDYMLSYSPYDQVTAQDYPHLFVTTGLHDSQVQYFEPAKWVAKLREMKTDNNKLLFDINMDTGHGGASGRFHRYKLMAMEYAFYFDLLAINE